MTESGSVYGLQAASWQNGEIIEPGLTKIGRTRRAVGERVAEMQSALGAGDVHRLIISFAVPVDDLRVEQAVRAALKSEGRHIRAGFASEWFSIEPGEAKQLVIDFAIGKQCVDAELEKVPRYRVFQNRSSIQGAKEIEMTPKRATALHEVRVAATTGGSPFEFTDGMWGAAATALAVEEGVSKQAALVVMREWFATFGTPA